MPVTLPAPCISQLTVLHSVPKPHDSRVRLLDDVVEWDQLEEGHRGRRDPRPLDPPVREILRGRQGDG